MLNHIVYFLLIILFYICLIENNNNLCIYPKAGTGNGLNKIIDYVKNKLKINNNKLNIENTIENEEKKVDVIFTNLKLDDSKLYIAYYKKGNKKYKTPDICSVCRPTR